jgi:beta-xylosidase
MTVVMLLTTILSTYSQVDESLKIPTLSSDNGDGTYTNPIIKADYPDPDIVRVGKDYYMASSSFVGMPGIPILHSTDLINWELIGHTYDSLTFRPAYSMLENKTAYGRICWAPTFKYHKGTYYVGVNINGDCFVMFKSKKPEGPYTMHKFSRELHDPGFFVDDDGKKYVVYGYNTIKIIRLRDDATDIMEENGKGTEIYKAPKEYAHVFEGCHMYKRNGYYYVFNTAKGYDGIECVSRSENLMGPYETRLLLDDDINYAGAGAHQGGFVDTYEGESWAFTFQDRDYLGRCPMLYPMHWENDWPVLDPKAKKGVVTYKKPAIELQSDLKFPQQSDDFSNTKLKPIWEFNHAPQPHKWSLTDRKGYFRIYSSKAPGFYMARNSLTQKMSGMHSKATVLLDATNLQNGDFAGCGIMGSKFFHIGLRKKSSEYWLELRTGDANSEKLMKSIKIDFSKLYIQTEITREGSINFYYSEDNIEFKVFGAELISNFGYFLGLRHTLTCYNLDTDKVLGFADFDYFKLESDYRGNHYDAFSVVNFDQYDNREGLKLVRRVSKRAIQYFTQIEQGNWLSFNNLKFKMAPKSIKLKVRNVSKNTKLEIRKGNKDGEILANCTIKKTKQHGVWEYQSFKLNTDITSTKIYFVFKTSDPKLEIESFFFK